jgi:hypothetical protein
MLSAVLSGGDVAGEDVEGVDVEGADGEGVGIDGVAVCGVSVADGCGGVVFVPVLSRLWHDDAKNRHAVRMIAGDRFDRCI